MRVAQRIGTDAISYKLLQTPPILLQRCHNQNRRLLSGSHSGFRSVFEAERGLPLVNLNGRQTRDAKLLQKIRDMAFQIDLVVEARDCRIPATSLNPALDHALPGAPKLIVYTHKDRGSAKSSQSLGNNCDSGALLVDARQYTDHRKTYELILAKLYAAAGPQPPLGYRVLLTGLPNSGKSSLLNGIRSAGLKKPGKTIQRVLQPPGTTTSISEKVLINGDPKIYLIDTPGILPESMPDPTHVLNLCISGAVDPKGIVDPLTLADYLLFQINRQYPGGGRYPGPQTDDVYTLLRTLSKGRKLPLDIVAHEWVTRYLNGGIAKLCLDDIDHGAFEAMQRHNRSFKPSTGHGSSSKYLRKQFMM